MSTKSGIDTLVQSINDSEWESPPWIPPGRKREQARQRDRKGRKQPGRKRKRAAYFRGYRKKRKEDGTPISNIVFVGVDTEGETIEGRHFCTMISYSSRDGEIHDSLRADPGSFLTSRQLLAFLITIPSHCRVFAYSFGYDITKIIQDLPNEDIYKLLRPETRPLYDESKPFYGRKPIRWNGFALNMDNLKFSIWYWPDGGTKKRVAVWDVIRFCQSTFLKAIIRWSVGTEEEREFVKAMKEGRASFRSDQLDEIQKYNLLECRLLAELVEKIISAHENLQTPSLPNGLRLRRYDGPGSTVTSLFREWGLNDIFKEIKRLWNEYPESLKYAIKCAYFGGRFENRLIGRAKGWNRDINSAYPYQACLLPCIIHGGWRRTKSRAALAAATLAIVQYELRQSDQACKSWGPLPIRLEDGCICYPSASKGGWVWRDEFIIAEQYGLWPGLTFKEAWVYERSCVCPNPLRNLAELYVERDRVGKDTGEGIVLKLGPNSCYGKMAQSIGNAPFQSWVLAGVITSGCRSQGLEAICVHNEPSNLVAIATDGILTLEDVSLPDPKPTGAEHCKKPLGGWDKELTPEIFLIRPGMYVGSKMKTRGVAEKTLKNIADAIVKDWDEHHDASRFLFAPEETRFIGARQGVYYVPGQNAYRRRLEYGNWVSRPQMVSFNPRPKREKALLDGTLLLRNLCEIQSVPYRKGMSPSDIEGGPMELVREIELDQPDGYEEMVYE